MSINYNNTEELDNVSSNRYRTQKITELILLLLYKTLFEFLVIPSYFSIWAYMLGDMSVHYDIKKSIISYVLVVCLYLVYTFYSSHDAIYDFTYKMLLYFSVIPSVAMYSVVDTIHFNQLIYPLIYFFVLTFLINKVSVKNIKSSIVFKKIRFLNLGILLFSFVFSVALWTYLGFPITFSLSDTFDQRITMRTVALPSIINYLYLMLGNVVIPYFFAKSLMNRNRIRAVLSLITGLLLFFSNGMKTWLLLYFIGIGLFVFYRMFSGNYRKIIIALEISFCAIIALSVIALVAGHNNFLLGQLGRVLIIPSTIGYQSVNFFTQPDHELLFLRESILKLFFESPYQGGSDFYINYGTNTTITSARANNGLWGDAFRNFGFVGMLIYPFLLMFILKVVINSMDKQRDSVKLFVILLLVWSGINTSFFTWLITGGMVFLILILKTEDTSVSEQKQL